MNFERVAFVGGGNMTRAIAGGLLADGHDPRDIVVAEPNADQREMLSRDLPGVLIAADNLEVVAAAGTLVFAVKPQIMPAVCSQICDAVQEVRPLILSIAAGVRSTDIDHWLGGRLSVIRVMPNQPALIRQGVSGLFANTATSADQTDAAVRILSSIGPVVVVPGERDIDAVTAVSGSGPAYFFLLIDMLQTIGARLGLEDDAAKILALETAKGAAMLASASHEDMSELIARVRSPGGTTAAALDCLEDRGVRDIFYSALCAARDRAIALADQAHSSTQD